MVDLVKHLHTDDLLKDLSKSGYTNWSTVIFLCPASFLKIDDIVVNLENENFEQYIGSIA